MSEGNGKCVTLKQPGKSQLTTTGCGCITLYVLRRDEKNQNLYQISDAATRPGWKGNVINLLTFTLIHYVQISPGRLVKYIFTHYTKDSCNTPFGKVSYKWKDNAVTLTNPQNP